MLKKLEQLELASASLDPSAGYREEMNARIMEYSESFLNKLPEMNSYEKDGGRSALLDVPFGEKAGHLPELLELFDTAVASAGINPASGGHMGYIPGGGIYPSALGDFLADVTNRYSGVSFASPGAAKMERQLVQWMTALVGYQSGAGGDLTSGGSIANLTAIVTARESMSIRARDVENSCVYMTADAHHCIDKSLRAAGLGECKRRLVSMDDQFRMITSELEQLILKDKSSGLRPWLIVASAGTTGTGALDPLDAMADLAEQHGLWLHVDAAYGGFFLLCEEAKELMRDLHRAHSIVLDPHKGMFLPYGSGAVLVKDENCLAQSQGYDADYMQDAKNSESNYSPADLSLELSRPFRGLRFWLPLKLFGLAPFRAALSEKIWLARYFYEQLKKKPGWELGPYPQLSVVTFRYIPDRGDVNLYNKRLIEAVQSDGRVFISSTLIDGNFVLRLAVLHFRTHLEQINYILDLLEQKTSETG